MKRLNLFFILLCIVLGANAQTLYVYDSEETTAETVKSKYPSAVPINTNQLLTSYDGYTTIKFVGKFTHWNDDFRNGCIKNGRDYKDQYTLIDFSEADLTGYTGFGIKLFNNVITIKWPEIGTYTIPNNSFNDNCGLKELTFGANCQGIGYDSFSQCSGLETLVFTEGMGDIKARSFRNMKKLKTVKIVIDVTKRPIECESDAFSFDNTDSQTNVDGMTTSFFMVGSNRERIDDEVSLEKRRHYCGNPTMVNTHVQSSLNKYRSTAKNGWQQFISNSGSKQLTEDNIPLSTFSIDKPITFPQFGLEGCTLSVFAVQIIGENKNSKAKLVQLNYSSSITIPANTGVLIYSPEPYRFNEYADPTSPVTNIKSALLPLCGASSDNQILIRTQETIGSETYRCFLLSQATKTEHPDKWVNEINEEGLVDYFSFFRSINLRIKKSYNKAYLRLPLSACPDGSIVRIGYDLQGKIDAYHNGKFSDNPDDVDYSVSANEAMGKGFLYMDLDFLTEEDAVTDIDSFTKNIGDDNIYYTLSGVKTTNPIKSGVYIHNGKKVVVK